MTDTSAELQTPQDWGEHDWEMVESNDGHSEKSSEEQELASANINSPDSDAMQLVRERGGPSHIEAEGSQPEHETEADNAMETEASIESKTDESSSTESIQAIDIETPTSDNATEATNLTSPEENVEFTEEQQQALFSIKKVVESLKRLQWQLERLPTKREFTLVKLYGTIWQDKVFNTHKLAKYKLDFGQVYTEAGLLVEELTKLLYELDQVNSFGLDKIRAERKQAVVSIQAAIALAERHAEKFLGLKNLAYQYADLVHATPVQKQNGKLSSGDTKECDSDEEVQESHHHGDDEGEEVGTESASGDSDHSEDEPMEEPSGKPILSTGRYRESPVKRSLSEEEKFFPTSKQQFKPSAPSTDGLPTWIPPHRVGRRGQSLVIEVQLGVTVDPSKVSLALRDDENGNGTIVCISGCKYPSKSDLWLAKHRGHLNFGQFNLRIKLPAPYDCLEDDDERIAAHFDYDDGILAVVVAPPQRRVHPERSFAYNRTPTYSFAGRSLEDRFPWGLQSRSRQCYQPRRIYNGGWPRSWSVSDSYPFDSCYPYVYSS